MLDSTAVCLSFFSFEVSRRWNPIKEIQYSLLSSIKKIGPTIIPDAAAIHLAKKKREQMRLRNDLEEEEFISLAGGDDDRVWGVHLVPYLVER